MKFKDYKEMIRPFDMILIVVIFVTSFIPLGIFAWQQANLYIPNGVGTFAVVWIAGEEIARFRLYEGAQEEHIFTREHGLTGNQYNLIEVKDNRVRIQRDNSPDQVGVNMGWAHRPGSVIICLPHSLWITIEIVSDDEDNDLIIPF